MSDRLAELVRQRALMQEHLAWLDREIAATTPTSPPSPTALKSESSSGVPAAPIIPLSPPPLSGRERPSHNEPTAGQAPALPTDAEKILAEYRVAPAAVKEDVRKGCLLYFAAAMVLLTLGVVVLYFAIRSR